MSVRYTLTEQERGSLAENRVAWYQEISIFNGCMDTIVILDSSGTQHQIPPSPNGAYLQRNAVVLSRRGHVGISKQPNCADVMMPGITATVSGPMIKQEPVYVKEFDVVICTPEDAALCCHPFQKTDYASCLEEGIAKISSAFDDAPMLKIMANDPTNSFDYLYTLIDTQVTKIPVTHMSGDDFVLTLIFSVNGSYSTEEIILNDFLTGKQNTMEFQNRVIPFVTTTELCAKEYGRSFRWITMSMFNESIDKLKIEHKAELETQKKGFEVKLSDSAIKATSLQTQISKLESERDDYKLKYDSIRNDLAASTAFMKEHTDRQKLYASSHISDNDVKISDVKTQATETEQKYKLWHIVLAASVPVLATLTVEVIKAFVAKK